MTLAGKASFSGPLIDRCLANAPTTRVFHSGREGVLPRLLHFRGEITLVRGHCGLEVVARHSPRLEESEQLAWCRQGGEIGHNASTIAKPAPQARAGSRPDGCRTVIPHRRAPFCSQARLFPKLAQRDDGNAAAGEGWIAEFAKTSARAEVEAERPSLGIFRKFRYPAAPLIDRTADPDSVALPIRRDSGTSRRIPAPPDHNNDHPTEKHIHGQES
jgi:hypothetical protein